MTTESPSRPACCRCSRRIFFFRKEAVGFRSLVVAPPKGAAPELPLVTADQKLMIGDAKHIAIRKRCALYALAVHIGAIGAVQVFNRNMIVVERNPAMML